MSERVESYAIALAEVAKSEGQLDDVANELYQVARAVEDNDALRAVLADQSVPASRRLGVIEDLLGSARPLTTNLVSLVVGAGRGSQLAEIADAVRAEAAAARGQALAEVRSAIALDDDQQARLAEALGRATGKNVDVQVLVDPSVMGGLVVQVDDTVFDGSVRHRLERLRETI